MQSDTTDIHRDPTHPDAPRAVSFEAWQALVAPGDVFRHPREVLGHPALSRAEKRAILASWASDAHALENAPTLRCLSGRKGEPVPLRSVLAALARLDAPAGNPPAPRASSPRNRVRRGLLSNVRRYIRRRDDDEDDPPPCPAAIMPRPRPPGPATIAVAACA